MAPTNENYRPRLKIRTCNIAESLLPKHLLYHLIMLCHRVPGHVGPLGDGAVIRLVGTESQDVYKRQGIDHPKLLVASHIKPWAVSSNTERLSEDNGLLLSATYDRLFDSGLITFDRHGKIYLSSLIGIENIKRLGLSNNMCFNLMINMNMGEYLDYHNDVLFVR